jgi:hypothetical protein
MQEQHVSYAMHNAEALESLIWFNNPALLKHWTHPLIECIVITGALLGLVHALRCWRREGQLANLYTWLACVFYGIFMKSLLTTPSIIFGTANSASCFITTACRSTSCCYIPRSFTPPSSPSTH